MNISLSRSELERYSRQMMLPKWGEQGQKKLKSSEVAIVGTGGLGCPASLYLAAAGIGKLILIDKERFELSNLNRQILGWQKDIGHPKAKAAADKLRELNSEIKVEAKVIKITENNVHELLQNADAVVDGMDNWQTRFLINKECVKNRIPFVHAGIFGLYGQITTIVPGKGPCLRCILPETPEEITKFPVPGATPSLFASLQVMETLKLIVGFGEPLIGRMLLFDGERMNSTMVKTERHPECPLCAHL
jgi:adenylyltransferase/sulfurtransferase